MDPTASGIIHSAASGTFAVCIVVGELCESFGLCAVTGSTGVGLNACRGTAGSRSDHALVIAVSERCYKGLATLCTGLCGGTGCCRTGCVAESSYFVTCIRVTAL